jgi:hypothetical protein
MMGGGEFMVDFACDQEGLRREVSVFMDTKLVPTATAMALTEVLTCNSHVHADQE